MSSNRLKRPIAVISGREAYRHLCLHCALDPSKNDIFFRVQFPWDVEGREFCRVLTLRGGHELPDYNRVLSAAKSRVVN